MLCLEVLRGFETVGEDVGGKREDIIFVNFLVCLEIGECFGVGFQRKGCSR